MKRREKARVIIITGLNAAAIVIIIIAARKNPAMTVLLIIPALGYLQFLESAKRLGGLRGKIHNDEL